MTKNQLFPALRCRMGETIYYATYMSFQDVNDWIKPTSEIHSSKKLSKWIQRQLIKNHAEGISDYLLSQDERFFNAIVVGIYGGEPTWSPLHVSARNNDSVTLTDEQRDNLDSSVGLLTLSGREKLFAIDGQHRVAGIKKAIELDCIRVGKDEIVALFVGHQKTRNGEQKTRRLFTTLNKTAKRVSDADRVALDEDDGFAVVTRRLIDEFDMFESGEPIAFAPTASLRTSDTEHISTIISLYSQIKDFYFTEITEANIKKSEFGRVRPDDEILDEVYKQICNYWKSLKRNVPELAKVFSGKVSAGDYRKPRKNHLLLRPIGQRAFAGATGVLVQRGATIAQAVKRLSSVDLWIHKKAWSEILWDPVRGVMLKSPILPETWLLRKLGEEARSNARMRKLDETLEARNS